MDCCISWLNSSVRAAVSCRASASRAPVRRGGAVLCMKGVSAERRIGREVGLKFQGFSSTRVRRTSFMAPASSSSSSWVEEDEEAMTAVAFEGSPEGSVSIDTEARSELMREVLQRLSEEELEEAAKKYDYEDELFAQIDFAQINAFTSKPFRGNPAAVCYIPYERNDTWLQLIAREFNLPATAFVIKRRSKKKSEGEGSPLLEVDDTGNTIKPVRRNPAPPENEFDIRWFSTSSELELCGHGTLAAAHMLFSSGLVEGDTIIFHGKKGTLKASKIAGYDDPEEPSVASGEEGEEVENKEAQLPNRVELGKGVVELDFPLSRAVEIDSSQVQAVSDALGAKAVWVGRTQIGDFLVELGSSKEVEQLRPNFEKIKELGGRCCVATAQASEDSKFDIVSRVFAPNITIPEDSATGSAHCMLGPYWASKLGKANLEAYQASDRGGEIRIRVDESAGRVYLQGGAVLVMAGTLLNTFHTC